MPFPIADSHNDSLLHIRYEDPVPRGHINPEGLKTGGARLLCFAAFVSAALPEEQGCLQRTLTLIDRFYAMTRALGLTAVTEPEQLTGEGPFALLTLEGGDCLEGELCNLRIFHALGARMLALTWSNDNALGCSCMAQNDTGLTEKGFAAIEEMNRLGMMVDVSHLSDKGFWQALESSRAPILASHSDARGLCPGIRRNLTDEMLAALGKKGGYVGVNAAREFLTGDESTPATVEHMADHVERMAAFAGIKHVGIGSDFDGISHTPQGFEDCGKYQNLAEALLRRNWSEADVRGVCWQNFVDYWTRAENAKG